MTESPTLNPGTVKLAAVAVGAYVLGRMKKGRAAVGLALWATGTRIDPKHLLRQGLMNLANSAEGKEILSQLRGPVLESGRRAVSATLENQAGALAKALESRTNALNETEAPEGEQDHAEDEEYEEAEEPEGEEATAESDEGDESDQGDEEEEEEPDEEPEPAPRQRRASAERHAQGTTRRPQPDQKPVKATRRASSGQQPAEKSPSKRATPASGGGDQPRRQSARSAPQSRAPRRPRKEGASA